MNPSNYYEQIARMNGKADKLDLRLRLVKSAITKGIKPLTGDIELDKTTTPLPEKIQAGNNGNYSELTQLGVAYIL